MVAIADDLLAEVALYERAERRIVDWALERRRQERQHDEFLTQVARIRLTNVDDGATAAVFHGQKHLSRRERMLQEHREQVAAERRNSGRRHELAVRRRKEKEKVECRHCGRKAWLDEDRKCERCKNDPDLVTARGTATRSYIPRLEAQPKIDSLSLAAQLIQALVEELSSREREVIERRYLFRQSDITAAGDLRMPTAMFAGLARGAVARISGWLANAERETV